MRQYDKSTLECVNYVIVKKLTLEIKQYLKNTGKISKDSEIFNFGYSYALSYICKCIANDIVNDSADSSGGTITYTNEELKSIKEYDDLIDLLVSKRLTNIMVDLTDKIEDKLSKVSVSLICVYYPVTNIDNVVFTSHDIVSALNELSKERIRCIENKYTDNVISLLYSKITID